MTENSQRPKGQGRGLSALNTAIDALNLAKETTSGTPANPVFGPVALLVTMIRVGTLPAVARRSRLRGSQDTMANEQDYIDLGLSCVDIYKALKRGMDGKELEELNKSVREAIDELKAWV